MKRIIKFRAWDIPTKRMLFVVNLQFRLDYREGLNGAVSGVDVQSDGSETLLNWELMQSTGLTDKNGVEIYEGDLIKWMDDILEVRWGSVGWNLYSKLFKRFGQPNGSNCGEVNTKGYTVKSEIVGNIYENPELLVK